MRAPLFIALVLAAAGGAVAAASACDSSSNAVHEQLPADAGGGARDAAADDAATNDGAPGTDCFSGTPTTYEQIINACTDAAHVDKQPTLKKLLPDGALPPLP
jgi:hypothetical protein